jgi:methyl halide transferase
MSDTDWEQRYRSGDTPWNKGGPSPGLENFLRAHPDLPRGRVLVPGCGFGHDVLEWSRHGFDVTGLELAPTGAARANEFLRSQGASVVVRAGDFLAPSGEAFDWLFEHTLYCAINPARRDDYAQAAHRWLKPGGQFLAVHYMIDDKDGPPFGCTQQELMQRFSPWFVLKEGWVPRSYPNRTGLELMLWWIRKDTP